MTITHDNVMNLIRTLAEKNIPISANTMEYVIPGNDTTTKYLPKKCIEFYLLVLRLLIYDMTRYGASFAELVNALRHYEIIYEGGARGLLVDYKQSELDNNIQQLRDEYQTDLDLLLDLETCIRREQNA